MLSEDHSLAAATAVSVLEGELRGIGLYVDSVEMHDQPGGPTVVIVDCLVGDLAWSDDVQNPATASFEEQWSALQTDLEGQAYQDRRRRLEERLDAGEDIFGDDIGGTS